MRKLISFILALGLALSLTACGGAPTNPGADTGPSVLDTVPPKTILNLFQDMTDVGLEGYYCREVTAEDAGFEMGYADFSGTFESAMALTPLMITDPFVLIIFRLAEGADAAAFAADIEKNADTGKWVCVSADKVFTRVSGRTVLFAMCGKDLEKPITECFAEMTKEGFKPEEHLVDPLAGQTAQGLYEELSELFGVDSYGFMDHADITALSAQTAYGLSALDLSEVEESIFDDGYAEKNEEEEERAYLFSIVKLKDGASGEAFAAEIMEKLDSTALQGGQAERIVAFGSNFVLFFAGTGNYGISATALDSHLSVTYRMSTQLF